MAYKVSIASGDWSTAANWGSVSNTPTMHASTNLSVSATLRYTAAFTSPGATVKCLGVLLFVTINPVSAGNNLVVTLQANPSSWADVGGASVSIPLANLPTTFGNGYWLFCRIPDTTMSTTSAGYYRFKVNTSGVTTVTGTMMADSGAANYAFLAVDDRTGAPGNTDDIFVIGSNRSNEISINVNGSKTIGGSLSTELALQRTIYNAINVSTNGTLTLVDAGASITCDGNMVVYADGTYTQTKTFTWAEATAGDHGGVWSVGARSCSVTGSTRSAWRAKYVSGVGTAADPLIIASPGLPNVADEEIVIGASSDNATNYQESESRYIKTRNSATSFVLCSTIGGAEAALTYTHNSNAWVVNLSQDCLITSDSTTKGWYIQNQNSVEGASVVRNVRMENCGSSLSSKNGFYVTAIGVSAVCQFSDVVIYRPLSISLNFNSSKVASTYSNVVMYATPANASTAISMSSVGNATFNDFMVFKSYRYSYYINSIVNCIFNRCITCGFNANSSATYGGWHFVGPAIGCVFNDCEAQAGRQGVFLAAPTGAVFNRFLAGTKGKNSTADIYASSDTMDEATFSNCTFGSDVMIANYLLAGDGSEIKFHALGTTVNKHRWYSNYGSARRTGAGLSDTFTFSNGNVAVCILPEESSTGFTWSFQVLCRPSNFVYCLGSVQKNAAIQNDSVTVELWLPGSTVSDDTWTCPLDQLENTFAVKKLYTGSVEDWAVVKVIAKSSAANAAVYVGNIFGGTNKITDLSLWSNGKPSVIMFEQLGDSAAVWSVPTSVLTASGSIGKQLAPLKNPKMLDNGAIIIS